MIRIEINMEHGTRKYHTVIYGKEMENLTEYLLDNVLQEIYEHMDVVKYMETEQSFEEF